MIIEQCERDLISGSTAIPSHEDLFELVARFVPQCLWLGRGDCCLVFHDGTLMLFARIADIVPTVLHIRVGIPQVFRELFEPLLKPKVVQCYQRFHSLLLRKRHEIHKKNPWKVCNIAGRRASGGWSATRHFDHFSL